MLRAWLKKAKHGEALRTAFDVATWNRIVSVLRGLSVKGGVIRKPTNGDPWEIDVDGCIEGDADRSGGTSTICGVKAADGSRVLALDRFGDETGDGLIEPDTQKDVFVLCREKNGARLLYKELKLAALVDDDDVTRGDRHSLSSVENSQGVPIIGLYGWGGGGTPSATINKASASEYTILARSRSGFLTYVRFDQVIFDKGSSSGGGGFGGSTHLAEVDRIGGCYAAPSDPSDDMEIRIGANGRFYTRTAGKTGTVDTYTVAFDLAALKLTVTRQANRFTRGLLKSVGEPVTSTYYLPKGIATDAENGSAFSIDRKVNAEAVPDELGLHDFASPNVEEITEHTVDTFSFLGRAIANGKPKLVYRQMDPRYLQGIHSVAFNYLGESKQLGDVVAQKDAYWILHDIHHQNNARQTEFIPVLRILGFEQYRDPSLPPDVRSYNLRCWFGEEFTVPGIIVRDGANGRDGALFGTPGEDNTLSLEVYNVKCVTGPTTLHFELLNGDVNNPVYRLTGDIQCPELVQTVTNITNIDNRVTNIENNGGGGGGVDEATVRTIVSEMLSDESINVSKRIGALEDRVDAIPDYTDLENRLANVENSVGNMGPVLDQNNTSVNALIQQVAALEARVQALEAKK